ncbi:unnamed protein product [Closterium sp. Yama58-4]|nr:unnamed protein product [Closterium sp. Yama58-4]
MAFLDSRVLLLIDCAAALLAAALGDDNDSRTFAATLLGVNEVPKNSSKAAKASVGDLRGVGYLRLTIYNSPAWVKFQVSVRRLKGEMPPTKTHVHAGKKGKNGDVLLDLPCVYAKKGDEYWLCEGKLGKKESERTAELKAALSKIAKRPSSYYGNVHTKRYSDGAVRGQLRKV